MRFASLPLHSARGGILAHTQRLPGKVLRKGIVVDADVEERLRDAGIDAVTVAHLEPGDVAEDDAADRVARAASGPGVRLSRALTGRCNAHASRRGLFVFDRDRLDAANLLDWQITLGTAQPFKRVDAGELLATVKIIPFAVPEVTVRATEAAVAEPGPLLSVRPFLPKRAGLVLTKQPRDVASLRERAREAQRARLGYLGCSLDRVEVCPHRVEAVAAAIERCLTSGMDLVLFLGASAIVDSRDVFPQALRAVGGQVRHIGMPVDPGNLLVLGEAAGRPVLGVPGCARSLKPSGYDWVLERLVAEVEVTGVDIMRMGAGGLLVEAASAARAPRPGKPVLQESVAGIVLAAGHSRRMGEHNKLLARIDGTPMVRKVVQAAVDAALGPVVVVTGHDAGEVRAALSGTPVRFVHNPNHEQGMGTSVAAGARAIEGADATFVLLGDMPDVTAPVLQKLVAAWTESGAGLVAPTRGGQRGNPVLFAASHLPTLQACQGDAGARALLKERADEVHLVPMDDDAVLTDIDTPDQLAARQQAQPS